jgi:glucose dehydrogenase
MIRKLTILLAITCGYIAAWSADGLTDGGKPADWLTDGGGPQRTAWQQDERILTTANVKDMKLLWKIKFDNEPRQMHNLLPALIVGRVNTSRGPKQIVIVTGVSDNVYAIDADKGELLWKHRFAT